MAQKVSFLKEANGRTFCTDSKCQHADVCTLNARNSRVFAELTVNKTNKKIFSPEIYVEGGFIHCNTKTQTDPCGGVVFNSYRKFVWNNGVGRWVE